MDSTDIIHCTVQCVRVRKKKIYTVKHYIKSNGRCPIEEFLLGLESKLRAKAFHDIELLQEYGPQLHGTYVKSIKGKRVR